MDFSPPVGGLKRFLFPKLATLRFSSRNDKAPVCGWGERKRVRSARFLSPPTSPPKLCHLEGAPIAIGAIENCLACTIAYTSGKAGVCLIVRFSAF